MEFGEVKPEDIRVVDKQGRVTLPPGFAGAVVKVDRSDENTVVIRRAVVEVVSAKGVVGE